MFTPAVIGHMPVQAGFGLPAAGTMARVVTDGIEAIGDSISLQFVVGSLQLKNRKLLTIYCKLNLHSFRHFNSQQIHTVADDFG